MAKSLLGGTGYDEAQNMAVSASGQIWKSSKGQDSEAIDLSPLHSGHYLLRVNGKSQVLVKH